MESYFNDESSVKNDKILMNFDHRFLSGIGIGQSSVSDGSVLHAKVHFACAGCW